MHAWIRCLAPALLGLAAGPGLAQDIRPYPAYPRAQLGSQPRQKVPGVPDVEIANVDQQCRLVAAHLATCDDVKDKQGRVLAQGHHKFSKDDLPYIRYLSWYATPNKEVRKRSLLHWLRHLTFEAANKLPKEVPGSEGDLWFLDLRDLRWTAGGFQAVARRDYRFREPFVNNKDAEFIRRCIGIAQDPKTFAVEGVVSADFLFRDSIETDRSTSYYDLLFGEDRFKEIIETTDYDAIEPSEWDYNLEAPGRVAHEIKHPGGVFKYPNGTSAGVLRASTYIIYRRKFPARSFTARRSFKLVKDFPANEDDWNRKFGLDVIVANLRKQRINSERGAIVAGSQDDPARGSIVSRNNRIYYIIQTPSGWAGETYDVKETAGNKDFSEEYPKFFKIDRHGKEVLINVESDAHEFLAMLPDGALAGLLTDGQGKRIERADTQIAHNHLDKRLVDVRTYVGCMTCHSPDNGVILSGNLVKEQLQAGVDLKVKSPEERNRIEAFFLDWEDQVDGWRRPYAKMTARATQTKADPKGWNGQRAAVEFLSWRNDYDDPLPVERQAAEVGIPLPIYKLLCAKSAKNRLNQAAQGVPIPRRTWETTFFREASLLLNAFRKDEQVSKVLPGYLLNRGY